MSFSEKKYLGSAGLEPDSRAEKLNLAVENWLQISSYVIEEMPFWIVVADPSFRVLYGNRSAMHLQGWKEKILGQSIVESLFGESGSEIIKDIYADLKIGQSWNGELTLHRKNGAVFVSHASVFGLRDGNGELIGFAAAGADVSERKRFEAQLVRTQRLESLGTLAGGIAHDFNNILGIISGWAALLQKGGDEKTYSEGIDTIARAAQRGAGVVKQLLAFVRKGDSTLHAVSVNDLVSEIIKLVNETFPKKISIATDLAKNLPLVVADGTQLHQVLLNLCLNARDAMPEGGTLKFTTKLVGSSSINDHWTNVDAVEYIQIEVSDSGIGMDEATKERVFEPFFTTKGRDKGTGLGLAVVFGIVEKHNGFVKVQSALGQGTTFQIFLPTPHIAVEERKKTEMRQFQVSGTETILCVEDEEMLLNPLKTELAERGYAVLTASDGAEALEIYRRRWAEINLVFSDLGLPMLDGRQLFEQMKLINPSVKFILCSGYLDAESKSNIFKCGMKEFIQKPFVLDEMMKKIRGVLNIP